MIQRLSSSGIRPQPLPRVPHTPKKKSQPGTPEGNRGDTEEYETAPCVYDRRVAGFFPTPPISSLVSSPPLPSLPTCAAPPVPGGRWISGAASAERADHCWVRRCSAARRTTMPPSPSPAPSDAARRSPQPPPRSAVAHTPAPAQHDPSSPSLFSLLST
jgi:hypothetical protein